MLSAGAAAKCKKLYGIYKYPQVLFVAKDAAVTRQGLVQESRFLCTYATTPFLCTYATTPTKPPSARQGPVKKICVKVFVGNSMFLAKGHAKAILATRSIRSVRDSDKETVYTRFRL